MFGLFSRRRAEVDKRTFLVDMLAKMLAIQCGIGGKDTLNDDVAHTVNLKALGYICGYCDAACQIAFGAKSQMDKDFDLTKLVLVAIFGPAGEEYIKLALIAISDDNVSFKAGLMKGGREYLGWVKSVDNKSQYTPMGLAGYLLGVDEKNG